MVGVPELLRAWLEGKGLRGGVGQGVGRDGSSLSEAAREAWLSLDAKVGCP